MKCSPPPPPFPPFPYPFTLCLDNWVFVCCWGLPFADDGVCVCSRSYFLLKGSVQVLVEDVTGEKEGEDEIATLTERSGRHTRMQTHRCKHARSRLSCTLLSAANPSLPLVANPSLPLVESPFFGEIALLLGQARTASILAVEECDFSVMSPLDFTEVMEMFPQCYVVIRDKCKERFLFPLRVLFLLLVLVAHRADILTTLTTQFSLF